MSTIYTVGHSTHPENEFISLLQKHNIDMLVDVRNKWAGSRHNPQFNKDAMKRWLPKEGIEYEHIPGLGGWRAKQGVVPALNGQWKHQGFHNYADYTLSHEFLTARNELLLLALQQKVAYMCAEAVPWRCHRLLLSNCLCAIGWDVQHILPTGALHQHMLGEWGARPSVSLVGTVTYPLASAERVSA